MIVNGEMLSESRPPLSAVMRYDLRDIIALARHAAMSTTYKPALLKAIAIIVSREPREKSISLTSIGAQFAHLYWNQTIVFHLRQAASIEKEPEVLQEIRTIAATYAVRRIADLPASAFARIERSMARILSIDVLKRFHASKPTSMPMLYSWEKRQEAIRLSDDARLFILANTQALIMIADHWWARYLEKVNISAPFIIEKIQLNGARRSSLGKYLSLLSRIDPLQCFYCGRTVDSTCLTVDHFLPWSYLLSDPLWDLVLACAGCNRSKSDRLPVKGYIDKLTVLNANRLTHGISVYNGPPAIAPDQVSQLFDTAIALQWPCDWVCQS